MRVHSIAQPEKWRRSAADQAETHSGGRQSEARRAFVHTARSVIDLGGQRVNATDKLYLAEAVPTLILWGAQDRWVPVSDAFRFQNDIAGAKLEVFDKLGHNPMEEDPKATAAAVAAFLKLNARPEDVTVADFADHIDYAVKRIGIDHVGISSDFDGGGWIKDWKDAGDSANVTLELVRRGYGASEIAALWGGNFLRLLRRAEEVADA